MDLRIVAVAALVAALAVADPARGQSGAGLSGTWVVVSSEQAGKPLKYPPKGALFTFEEGKVMVGPKKGKGKTLYTFKVDPKKDPKEIDLIEQSDQRKIILHGIYRMEKGRLVICVGVASGSGGDKVIEGKRPTEFKSGPKIHLMTFEPGGG